MSTNQDNGVSTTSFITSTVILVGLAFASFNYLTNPGTAGHLLLTSLVGKSPEATCEKAVKQHTRFPDTFEVVSIERTAKDGSMLELNFRSENGLGLKPRGVATCLFGTTEDGSINDPTHVSSLRINGKWMF